MYHNSDQLYGKYHRLATVLLRTALAAGFLSSVASRLGWFGSKSSGWKSFLAYTSEVNTLVPPIIIPTLAMVSTILEITIAVLLLIGYKTRWAATGAALLTLLFGLAMSFPFGLKESLDYSVFTVCTGAFLLANSPTHKWSIDQKLIRKNRK